MKRLVELENVLEEDKSSESSWLNILVVVTNVSQKIDNVVKISKTSGIEGFSFTSNNGSSVGSSSIVGWEVERLTDNQGNQLHDGLLKDWSLRGVSSKNVNCGLESRLSGNRCTGITAVGVDSSVVGEAFTHSCGVGISELTISLLGSLNIVTPDVLELVNLVLRDLLD